MAITAPTLTLLSPSEVVASPALDSSSTRLQDLLLRYSEGSVPFGLWLPPEEEWEASRPSGLWARVRYWFKRLASAELGNDDD